MTSGKQLGQYFTTDETLLSSVASFVQHTDGKVLEPSCGAGHIVHHLVSQKGDKRDYTCVEIDTSIKFLPVFERDNVALIHSDFLAYDASAKYKTIVGNPPYVKRKGVCNLYVEFISKCLDLLTDDGELIFVIPSDFFKLTSASSVKTKMLAEGSFTHVFHPQKENLFLKAAQDVIVFRYEKGHHTDIVLWNGVPNTVSIKSGNIYIHKQGGNGNTITVGELFYVKVGMVSGSDAIFKNDKLGNMLVKTTNGDRRYIMYEEFPKDEQVQQYLENHKHQLQQRRITKITEKNWYKWGCLRNIDFMNSNTGKECIYCSVLTRKRPVFFKGKVMHYDGSLLCMLPKCCMNLEKALDVLNSDDFLSHFMYSGRYKIGQKSLSDCVITKEILNNC